MPARGWRRQDGAPTRWAIPLPRAAFLERSLDLLPAASPLRAGSMIELAAAGWNLLPNEEVQRLLDDGAELAAEHGLRAVELRARILRLGAASEAAPLTISDEYVIAETSAALRELEALDDPRALATALCARAESEYSLGRSADALASVVRALDTLRAADEDSVWAVSILNAAAVESPLSVPDAERLLGGLIDEIGMRPTVRAELMQGQAMLAVLAGRADDAGGCSTPPGRSRSTSAGRTSCVPTGTVQRCWYAPAGSTKRGRCSDSSPRSRSAGARSGTRP